MADSLCLYRGTEPVTAARSPQQMQDYLPHFQEWIVSLTKAGKDFERRAVGPGQKDVGRAPGADDRRPLCRGKGFDRRLHGNLRRQSRRSDGDSARLSVSRGRRYGGNSSGAECQVNRHPDER